MLLVGFTVVQDIMLYLYYTMHINMQEHLNLAWTKISNELTPTFPLFPTFPVQRAFHTLCRLGDVCQEGKGSSRSGGICERFLVVLKG